MGTSTQAVSLYGTITTVTSHGRCGLVTLTEPYRGYDTAVINSDTIGRLLLMSRSPKGELVSGTKIVIAGISLGPEALHVAEIAII